MSDKLKVSSKTQQLINVEKLLTQIGMLDNTLRHINFEWYPKEVQSAISKFAFNDINEIQSALIQWIESNVDEKYFD